jgi:PAS domain S-box-containing protein
LNKENLSGELLSMRSQLLAIKEKDEKRNWFNSGLSKFLNVIRENQNTLKELCDHFISDITKYSNSRQGTLMLVEQDERTEEKYLEIKGMYAYDRKKYVNKRIEINSGLAGQCYLEGETIYLTNIPQDYVNITSGLGEAKPDALLIVPIKTDESVVGVLELAAFNKYDEHVIQFVENLASNLATAISVTRNNEQTLTLLRKTQEQTEELKATEEEIRQNMEELQATQEQMNRKNEEVNRLLENSIENEEVMKIQLEEFESLKQGEEELIENLEAYRSMMLDVLNELPFKVFLKDEEGKIFLVNTKVAEAHNMEIENLIGKSDHDFVDKETADLWRQDELEIIKKGEETYVFEEDFGHGKRIMETIKKRFYIRPIKQIGLLGIQKDITNESNAATRLKEFNKIKQNA